MAEPTTSDPVAPSQQRWRIAVLAPLNYAFGRNIMRGVASYCLPHHISTVFLEPAERMPDARHLGANGMVATVAEPALVHYCLRMGLPAVNVSARMEVADFPRVTDDSLAVGRLAAEHLLERNLKSFAYFGPGRFLFVERRLHGFHEALRSCGRGCVAWMPARGISWKSIAAWLRKLAKPVGIMAAADSMAAVVVQACRLAELQIPQDVVLIGVDNDEPICLLSDTPLSSVDPNHEGVGYEAARLLHHWLVEGRPPPAESLIAPRGVVPRQSTDVVATCDELVAQALRIVRERLAAGLTVKDLLNELVVSRRKLELAFRTAIGRTPAEEIRRAAIDRACRLLIETELSLDRVAQASGLGCQRRLRELFGRALGVSPTAYRARFRGKTT